MTTISNVACGLFLAVHIAWINKITNKSRPVVSFIPQMEKKKKKRKAGTLFYSASVKQTELQSYGAGWKAYRCQQHPAASSSVGLLLSHTSYMQARGWWTTSQGGTMTLSCLRACCWAGVPPVGRSALQRWLLLCMTHRTPGCPGASYEAETGHSSVLQMCQAWTHLWGKRWKPGGVLLHLQKTWPGKQGQPRPLLAGGSRCPAAQALCCQSQAPSTELLLYLVPKIRVKTE